MSTSQYMDSGPWHRYSPLHPSRDGTVYEHRRHQPLPRRHFIVRMLVHGACAVAVVLFSLALGIAGYQRFEHLSFLDAFLNTAMLLSGMGPVDPPITNAGKLFAGVFALYAGIVFLVVAGLLLAPMVHRLLHKFHWEADTGRHA